jgi:hypothetical protein
MPGRLVTIGTYGNLVDAQVAKGALEAAGIRALIVGENVAANFQLGAAIPLAVDEDDAEAAEQIVNAMIGIAHAEHVGPSDAAPPIPPAHCPSCGSPEVQRRARLPAFALVVALALGVGLATENTLAAFFVCLTAAVFFIAAAPWRCRHCGHTW